MKVKQLLISAVVFIATAFGQSFPTVDHPGGGLNTGWSVISPGNVFYEGWSNYNIPLTNGNQSSATARTISGRGTQPYGVAFLAPLASGGSAIQKTINIPSTNTYRFNMEVFGYASCLSGGCPNGVLPAYGYLNVYLDGVLVTFNQYGGNTINTTSPRITNGIAEYVGFNWNLSAGNHVMKIVEVTGTDSNNHPSGGSIAFGQIVYYPTNITLQATCGYTTDGTNWTSATVTSSTLYGMVTACEQKTTFTGGGRRLNLKSDVIYTPSSSYFGCGTAGTTQCELLDIE